MLSSGQTQRSGLHAVRGHLRALGSSDVESCARFQMYQTFLNYKRVALTKGGHCQTCPGPWEQITVSPDLGSVCTSLWRRVQTRPRIKRQYLSIRGSLLFPPSLASARAHQTSLPVPVVVQRRLVALIKPSPR
ncbi:hypothetical protein BaRGS_00035609 [Batillaria attramentaria]|uniref:Uncharacterized protein n=1 Tax=Batillaria attramentaria TaxID=370345 RepID=A0ABD0JDW5_9CAEN